MLRVSLIVDDASSGEITLDPAKDSDRETVVVTLTGSVSSGDPQITLDPDAARNGKSSDRLIDYRIMIDVRR